MTAQALPVPAQVFAIPSEELLLASGAVLYPRSTAWGQASLKRASSITLFVDDHISCKYRANTLVRDTRIEDIFIFSFSVFNLEVFQWCFLHLPVEGETDPESWHIYVRCPSYFQLHLCSSVDLVYTVFPACHPSQGLASYAGYVLRADFDRSYVRCDGLNDCCDCLTPWARRDDLWLCRSDLWPEP